MFTAGALIVQGSIHRHVTVTDNINDQTGKARGGKLRLDLAGLECRTQRVVKIPAQDIRLTASVCIYQPPCRGGRLRTIQIDDVDLCARGGGIA